MVELLWTLDALTDLDSIGEYIARGSPDYAPVSVQKIVAAAEKVREFPQIGRVVPEFGDDHLREVMFQSYRIVYRLKEGRIGILPVWHGAMDLAARRESRPWDFT